MVSELDFIPNPSLPPSLPASLRLFLVNNVLYNNATPETSVATWILEQTKTENSMSPAAISPLASYLSLAGS